uniref:Variant surface glycoprotein 1125.146 n=1 Tax=Trypanosoma brucei TaxID=5691 RepID=A0A1J0R5B3_9TRYP|nr:variant surface glycoprotein 1125.146 [Trypanosoma brucei]
MPLELCTGEGIAYHWLLLINIIWTLVVSPTAAVDEAAGTATNNRCSEMKYLTALRKHVETETATKAGEIASLKNYADAWTLAALRERTAAAKAVFQSLAAHATAEYTKHQHTQKQLETAANQAILHLTARRAYIAALFRQPTLATGDAKKVSGDGEYAAGCKYTLTQTAAATTGCDESTATDTGVGGTAFTLATATSIKLLNLAKTPARLPDFQAHGRGTQGSIDGATADKCTDGGSDSTNGLKLILGTVPDEEALTPASTDMYDNGEASSDCKPLDNAETSGPDSNQKTAFLICKWLKTARPQPKDMEEIDPATLKESDNLVKLYTAYLTGSGRYTADQAKTMKTEIKDALKSLLGGDKNSFKNKYISPFKEKNFKYADAAAETTTSLFDVAKQDKVAQALIYVEGQEAAEQDKKVASSTSCPSNTESSKKRPSKEDCKDHKELGPCEKAGCKFDGSKNDGEKCFPDPEKKTENKEGKDGKTESKCTGKEQKDCKDGCKWEDNKCKDSSFLVNKKFAPIDSAL